MSTIPLSPTQKALSLNAISFASNCHWSFLYYNNYHILLFMYLPSLLDGVLSQLWTQLNLASADTQNICVE